jgi:hypothetical protein
MVLLEDENTLGKKGIQKGVETLDAKLFVILTDLMVIVLGIGLEARLGAEDDFLVDVTEMTFRLLDTVSIKEKNIVFFQLARYLLVSALHVDEEGIHHTGCRLLGQFD